MQKYVALIRGIGPGNPNMANQKLRETIESVGLTNVQSVISSGNIIFESKITDTNKLEIKIETALRSKLGIPGTTIVRSQVELEELIKATPFKNLSHGTGSYLLVTFFKRPTKIPFKLPYQPDSKPYILLSAIDRGICTTTDNSVITTSDLMTWLEKQFSKDISSRTWLTVNRILKKMNIS